MSPLSPLAHVNDALCYIYKINNRCHINWLKILALVQLPNTAFTSVVNKSLGGGHTHIYQLSRQKQLQETRHTSGLKIFIDHFSYKTGYRYVCRN